MSVTGAGNIRARLRPRETGEIFSEAFRLYRENWKLYWGIVLVFFGPFAVLTAAWESYLFHPAHVLGYFDPMEVLPGLLPVLLLMYVAIFLIYFGLIRAVSENYLGRSVRFADVVKPTPRFWGMVGANLLVLLAFAGATAIIGILAVTFAAVRLSPAWLVIPGLSLFVFLYILLIRWSVATSVAVIEGRGSRGSLGRSLDLVRGFGRKAFNICFGAVVLYYLVQIVIGEILGVAFASLLGVHAVMFGVIVGAGVAGIALTQLIQTVGAMIAIPIVLLPLVLFYYDLRVRKEAFDLQMLAEQLGYGYQEVGSESPAAV